jgi:superfamily II DNA or RNA helicase
MIPLRAAYRAGYRAPLLQLATGGGKTIIFSAITASAHGRGRRVLIVAHWRELIRQASAKLTAAGVPHGIIAPGHPESADAVQVASAVGQGRVRSKPNAAIRAASNSAISLTPGIGSATSGIRFAARSRASRSAASPFSSLLLLLS